MTELNKRELLLDAAKKEFIQYGFQKASLRRIAASVDMTTGAIYFFFKNKEDIFDSLIGNVADDIKAIIREETNKDSKSYESFSSAIGTKLVEYYYDHLEEANLLFNCSEGSIYEHYNEFVEKSLIKRMHYLKDTLGKKDNDSLTDQFIDILAHVEVDAIISLLRNNPSREEALKETENLVYFFKTGFYHLINE